MVTALGTLSAYLKDPQLKAVTATIPIPCGFAYIAVGLPMGTENAVSGFMCMLYVHIVRILHYKVKVPIVASIIAGLAFFVALGTFLHSRIPQGEAYFNGACIFDFIIGVIFFQKQKRIELMQSVMGTIRLFVSVSPPRRRQPLRNTGRKYCRRSRYCSFSVRGSVHSKSLCRSAS